MRHDHPDPAAIDRHIARIRTAAAAHPNPAIDMGGPGILERLHGTGPHTHRTIACLGSWYFIAAAAASPLVPGTPAWRRWRHANRRVDTSESGASAFAAAVGFEEPQDLMEWGRTYPVLWGNAHGETMFLSARAYDRTAHDLTLDHVLAWWQAVAGRIRAVTD